jgi:threonine synthase
MQKQVDSIGVFLETAHPIKFLDVVEPILKVKLPIPTQIKSILDKEKRSVKINNYDDLKAILG